MVDSKLHRSSFRQVLKGTLRATSLIQNRKYTPYPLGTPHLEEDVANWPDIAIENCARSDTGSYDTEIRKYSTATSVAYAMIDRGVARAQGLLQFNSLILAGGALLITGLNVVGEVILSASLVLLTISTLLALSCLWIIWYRPETSIQEEARMTWEVWLSRSLLFNVSLLLALPAFFGVALVALLKVAHVL